jgi:dipeptide/tripeptide permease
MEALLGWFDLSARSASLGPAAADQVPLIWQVLLYALVVVGVLLSEAVAMARKGGPIDIELSWTWVAIACLVALPVFPAVWREIGAMADASLIVQMGLAAQGGVFWGVLMAGAEKQAQR